MANYMSAQAQDDVRAMIAQVKTLTVEKLKNLLRNESMSPVGRKPELQIRSITHIEKLRNAGDTASLGRIRDSIRGLGSFSTNSYQAPNSSASPSFSSPIGHYNMPSSNPAFGSGRITFKPSPFYTITRPLTQMLECKARESTRDTARLNVQLPQDIIDTIASDSTYRVMVFCASEAIGPFSRDNADVTFPHNVELKCNGDDVKANLRGLKNRPGSTRPVDITNMLRMKPANYVNTVEMVYALTNKKFYLVVNLVSKKSVEAMVSQIRHGRIISKETVLREMRRKAEDPDEIVATSTVLSLKDPVGYTRITTPCRGVGCSHVQCFDAAYYLQLQEQAPTWTCPICNKPALWEQLALDQYVNDILTLTTKDVEAVILEPLGAWHLEKATASSTSRKSNPTPSDDEDDDDDIVEVGNASGLLQHPKLETLTPRSVRTPPLSSREDSSAPSASRPSTNNSKRPHAVVDLTLSDDEDSGRPAPKAPRLSMSEDPIISSARPPSGSDSAAYRKKSSQRR